MAYPNGGNRGPYAGGSIPMARRGRISKGAEALKGWVARVRGTKNYR